MELPFFFSLFLAIFCAAVGASETHTITFVNQCGYGTPCLIVNGQNVSTGASYTAQGTFAGIGYLQTGQCDVNGEGCTLLETNLANPTCAGCGSSVDISLIAPHVFNVETSFAYYNGCDGLGADCNDASCGAEAFFSPDDWAAQRQCEIDNVNLLVAFCANASEIVLGGNVPVAGTTSFTTPTPSVKSTYSSRTPSSYSGATPSYTSTSKGPTPSGPKSCRSRRDDTPGKQQRNRFAQ